MNANNLLIWAVAFFLSGFIGNHAAGKVGEGNRLFEKSEYGEALKKYTEAQEARPNAPEIPFNMGNSFYRQKQYKEAIGSHQRALELSKGTLDSRAHYNIGNSFYREGDPKGALESYKRAVDLNPSDFDTKYNIEFIQKKLKEESGGTSQKKESKGKEKEKETAPQSSQGKEEEPKPREISKEDAERLLNALQSEEKPLNQMPGESRREEEVEKDW